MFDVHTFVNLVRSMRESQSKYFKTKDWNALNDSKAQERMVDKAIKEYDEEYAKKNGTAPQNDLPF